MSNEADSPVDRLWLGYSDVFREFDDLTLARWMAQTLGQLQGRVWRLTHPLVGAYRLAAQVGHDRQIWLKRLATPPSTYSESPCCRAPLLPLVTRDIMDVGLVCQHCAGTAAEWDDLPPALVPPTEGWAQRYGPVHAVAHWDDRKRKSSGNYDAAFENAARSAEALLAELGSELAPHFLDHYPVILWEDQDECLEVRPEDISA